MKTHKIHKKKQGFPWDSFPHVLSPCNGQGDTFYRHYPWSYIRGRNRTFDLWVMGPTRYHCATLINKGIFPWDCSPSRSSKGFSHTYDNTK